MKPGNVGRTVALSTTVVPGPEIAEREQGNSGPTPEEIRRRAFEIHIERGGIHGCDLDDWMQAEHELQEKYKSGQDRPKNK